MQPVSTVEMMRGTLNTMDMNLVVALVIAAVLVVALVARSKLWAEIIVTAQLTKLVTEGALRGGDAALLWTVLMRWHFQGKSVWVARETLVEMGCYVGHDMAEDLGVRTVLMLQAAGDRYWAKHGKLMPEPEIVLLINEGWRRYPEERFRE